MKQFIFSFVFLTFITGCQPVTTGTEENSSKQKFREDLVNQNISHITTNDGLDCVFYEGYQTAGLSCNWEKYNLEKNSK